MWQVNTGQLRAKLELIYTLQGIIARLHICPDNVIGQVDIPKVGQLVQVLYTLYTVVWEVQGIEVHQALQVFNLLYLVLVQVEHPELGEMSEIVNLLNAVTLKPYTL